MQLINAISITAGIWHGKQNKIAKDVFSKQTLIMLGKYRRAAIFHRVQCGPKQITSKEQQNFYREFPSYAETIQ